MLKFEKNSFIDLENKEFLKHHKTQGKKFKTLTIPPPETTTLKLWVYILLVFLFSFQPLFIDLVYKKGIIEYLLFCNLLYSYNNVWIFSQLFIVFLKCHFNSYILVNRYTVTYVANFPMEVVVLYTTAYHETN